jgi:hypothetical protein
MRKPDLTTLIYNYENGWVELKLTSYDGKGWSWDLRALGTREKRLGGTKLTKNDAGEYYVPLLTKKKAFELGDTLATSLGYKPVEIS